MHDFYDRLENRTATARETALFRDLRHIVSVSKSRVPALRAQLKGLDLGRSCTRTDLSQIPIRRCGDLLAAQAELPPFGGYAATRMAALAQIFTAANGLLSLAGYAKDWWGMGRALYAAGLRKGTPVLNAFSYDLVPDGHMVESGAHAIGCPVISAGNASPEQMAPALAHAAPRFFCGRADRLKRVLDHAETVGTPTKCITHALVPGPVKPGLRHELTLRGIDLRCAILLPEVGVIAYESGTSEGLTLTEGLILEIVDPESGDALESGKDGEIVVSRINMDYPLLRFATGLTASILTEPSTCGRTNTRISMPRPLCDTESDSAHIAEIRKRHPDLKMRLWVKRPPGVPHLKVESRGDEPSLRERLGETLRVVTRRHGTVEIVRPGTLPEDDGYPVDDGSASRH